MNEIRYKQRVCRDEKVIERFLETTRVGVVGLVDGNGIPYAVPVNFVWHEGAVYFHGMGSGKKDAILAENPDASFTLFHEFGTTTDPVPCKADTSYMSVMIFGKAVKLSDFAKASGALQKLLEKYTPGFYQNPLSAQMVEKYRSSHDNNPVAVYKIEVAEMTAKHNLASEDELFGK